MCYGQPEILERYPSPSKFNPRRYEPPGGVITPHRMPATATAAKPGTEEKIAVMAERAKRGESVFHPRDGQA